MHEIRETSLLAAPGKGSPAGEGESRTTGMNGGEESDGVVVPMSPSNKATEQQAEAAEREEGRTPTGENTSQTHTPPAQDAPRRVPGIGGCAQSSAGKEAGTVHHTAASRDDRSAARRVFTH